jgi:hypothetical protein
VKLTADEARNCGIDVPKQNKYRNVKVVVDGIKFDSTKEANRYAELKMMEKAGEIVDLETQPEYPYCSDDNSRVLFKYRADFRYILPNNRMHTSELIVEDVKGVRTQVYILKKKLIEDRFGIVITEV